MKPSRSPHRHLPLFAMAVALLLAHEIRAQEENPEAKPGPDGWRVSLSLGLEAQQFSEKSRSSSTLLTSTRVQGNQTIGVPASSDDDDSIFTVVVPFGVELAAPTLEFLPGRPRPFVEAAYQWAPASNRTLLEQGKPGSVNPPIGPSSPGLGLELRQHDAEQWQASLGLSFPITVSGQPVEIRPSLGYLGQYLQFRSTVVGVQAGTNALFQLTDEGSQVFHSLGPRLAVEAPVGSRGPFQFVVFLDLAGYLLVGDSEATGGTSMGTETSEFRYEPDTLAMQGGVGLRIVLDSSGASGP